MPRPGRWLDPVEPDGQGTPCGQPRGDTKGPATRSKSDNFAHSMYYAERDYRVVDAISVVAEAHGKTPAQIALG